VENKQFIYTDSFSYGSGGNKYFDLQWLFQLFVYALYNNGEKVLIITNALLVAFSMVLLYVRFKKIAQPDNRNLKLAFFAFVVLIFVQPLSFEIRPHVFSWIFLNIVLLLLEAYKKGDSNSLMALPLIMLIWVNTHSLAILGIVAIAVYNTGIYFENKKADKKLLLFSGLSLAAFMINPYFIDGFIYPFRQFGIISGNNLLKSYIGEFQSPFTAQEIKMLGSRYFTSPLLIIHLSALLAIFSIARSVIKKQFTHAILIAAFFVLLYLAHKNYGYFFIAGLPFFVNHILEWFEARRNNRAEVKIQPGKRKNKTNQLYIASEVTANFKWYRPLSYITIMAAILISITTVTDGYAIFRNSPYRFGFTADNDQLPTGAVSFLNKNQLKGKMLNHLDYGGYLMYHCNEKVFIDGRLEVIDEGFFKKYYESNTVRNGIKNLLDEYNPGIVVFPYIKASYWWDYFVSNKNKSGYKAVYFDGLSVVYVKSEDYPQLKEINENEIFTDEDNDVMATVNKYLNEPVKHRGVMVLSNGLWQKQILPVEDHNKATYCFANGYFRAALNYSAIALNKSTVHMPAVFKSLAIYFQDNKMYNELQLCEEKSE
jgi:hypothetical protein